MTIAGIITIYTLQWLGQPLYCDRDATLFYTFDTEPWIAIDASRYEDGSVQCGDTFHLIGDGWEMYVKAYDAGYFDEFCVWSDYECGRIVADIPEFLAPFEGMSDRVEMINVSAMARNAFR